MGWRHHNCRWERALFHSVAFSRQILYSVRSLSHFLCFNATKALKCFELFVLITHSPANIYTIIVWIFMKNQLAYDAHSSTLNTEQCTSIAIACIIEFMQNFKINSKFLHFSPSTGSSFVSFNVQQQSVLYFYSFTVPFFISWATFYVWAPNFRNCFIISCVAHNNIFQKPEGNMITLRRFSFHFEIPFWMLLK